MIFQDERKNALRKANFVPIPLIELDERYWISKECMIIDIFPEDPKIIYEWSRDTAYVDIQLTTTTGEDVMEKPIFLLFATYYGVFNSGIIRMRYNKDLVHDFQYVITSVEPIDDSTIKVNDMIFKLSPRYQLYATKDGCVYDGISIVRHFIDQKGYHITSKTSPTNIQRIVYDAWIGIEDPSHDIHHKDGRNWNNHIDNLQELTKEEHKEAHQVIGNRNYRYSDETVEKVCKLMSEGVRPAEAARIVGIPPETAVRYRAGQRPSISQKYTYPPIEKYKNAKLSSSDVEEICKLFCEGKLTNLQIGMRFGVDGYTIGDIREGRTWKDVSQKYSFTKANPTTRKRKQDGNRRNATITEEDVIKIYTLLHQGVKPKDLSRQLGISYYIIKKIKYKIRWTSITDKLDEQFALENSSEKGSTTIETVAQEKDLSE